MKKQVTESLELARANLDQAIAGLEQIPELDAESVGYTAHKLWIRACHCQGYRRKTRRDALVRKPTGAWRLLPRPTACLQGKPLRIKQDGDSDRSMERL